MIRAAAAHGATCLVVAFVDPRTGKHIVAQTAKGADTLRQTIADRLKIPQFDAADEDAETAGAWDTEWPG